MTTLPCFVCGTEMEPVMPPDHEHPDYNQPWGGTRFQTGGHYGSIFDPMNSDKLEINICDICLIEGNANVVVRTPCRCDHCLGYVAPAKPWDPDEWTIATEEGQ